MPVIAESPPLIFGEGVEPGVPVPPLPPPTPPIIGPPPAIIVKPPGICNLSDILANHKIFIDHVDMLGACFTKEAMPEFTDQNFDFHTNLAIVDKYITKDGETYCSMQAVQNLSRKLKRFRD